MTPPTFDADASQAVYPNVSYIANGVTPVEEAVLVSPADGQTNTSTTVTLTAGASGMPPGPAGFGYRYRYDICAGNVTFCGSTSSTFVAESAWVNGSWTVPAGTLAANATYVWTASVRNNDFMGTLFNPVSAFSTGSSLAPYASYAVALTSPARQSLSSTLTPTLSAALVHAPAASYQFDFTVQLCANSYTCTAVADSGWIAASSWTVPSGALGWSGQYKWTAAARDNPYMGTIFNPERTIATVIPVPVGSRVGVDSSAKVDDVGLWDQDFQYSTTDATVQTPGQAMKIQRSYSSISQVDGAFGSGWWSIFSMAYKPTAIGASVLLADGHELVFGKNPDGTFVPGPGATGTRLASCSTPCVATFTDATGSSYQFNSTGLASFTTTDGFVTTVSRSADGKVTAITDQSSGRTLRVTWSGSHVVAITQSGAPSEVPATWTYTYSGTTLTSACAPNATGIACERYAYTGATPLLASVTKAGNSVPSRTLTYSGSALASSTSDGLLTTYVAAAAGTGKTVTATTATGGKTVYTLDGAGRLIDEAVRGGRQRWQYDAQSRMNLYQAADGSYLQLTYPATGAVGQRELWRADGTYAEQDYAYIATAGPSLGKLWMTTPQGTFWLWGGIFGYSESQSDRELEYDANGRVAAVNVGAPGTGRSTERYTYTTGGEVTNGGTMPKGLLASVTDPGGGQTTYAYNTAGDLVQQTAPDGVVTTYTRDWAGRATQVSRSGGGQTRTVSTTYDTWGNVASTTYPEVTDAVTGQPQQRADTFTYDGGGRLLTQTQADLISGKSRTTSFTYDGAGRLLTQTDPSGALVVSRTYDAFGRLSTSATAAGAVTAYDYTPYGDLARTTARSVRTTGQPAHDVTLEALEYDASGRVAARTDQAGLRSTYTYAFDDNIATVTAHDVLLNDGTKSDVLEYSAAYDTEGRLSQTNRNGATVGTRFLYDDHDRPTQMWLALPSVAGVPAASRVVELAYDTRGNVVTESVGAGGSSHGTVTSYAYDSADRVTGMTKGSSTSDPSAATTRYAYNGVGELVGRVDPRAGTDTSPWTTTYGRDALGRLVTTQSPQSDDGSRATTSRGYDAFDELTAERGPNGQLTDWSYDADARQTSSSAPHADGATPSSTVTTFTPTGAVASVTDTLGTTTAFSYDSLGRLIQQTSTSADATASRSWSATWTDAGYPSSLTDPTGARSDFVYDTSGRLRSRTSPLASGPATTSYQYDAAGNITSIVDPSGDASRAVYDGARELVSYTDPDGVGQTLYRDFLGRVVKAISSDGTGILTNYNAADEATVSTQLDAAGQPVSTRAFSYDAAGNQISATNPLGATQTLGFDRLSRLTTLTYPDGAHEALTYDLSGNATSLTDALGRTSNATYDAVGNRTSLVEPPAGPLDAVESRTWQWAYDSAGRQVSETQPGGRTINSAYDAWGDLVGRTGTQGSASASSTFQYDALGRMTTYTNGSGAGTATYDPTGQIASTDGPAGASSFTYDANGRVATRADGAGLASFTWTPGGRLASATLPALGQVDVAYDKAGRATTVRAAQATTTRTYDPTGAVASEVTAAANGTVLASATYTHDAAGELIQKSIAPSNVAGAGTTAYGYDVRGRLTSWTDQTEHNVAWDAVNDATSIDGVARTFDGRGRLTTQGATSYSYDLAGELTGVTDGHSAARTLTYDALGYMTSDGTDSIAYDAQGRVVRAGAAALGYAGASRAPSTVGEATYVRAPDGTLLGVGQSLAVLDPHRDVTGLVGSDGTLTSTRYTPFGATSNSLSDLGFQSDLQIASGLVQMNARWYDPASATFTTRDDTTLSLDQQNRYAYTAGDPLDYADPSGRCFVPVPAVAAACAGGEVGGELGSAAGPEGTVIGAAVGATLLGVVALIGGEKVAHELSGFSLNLGSGAKPATAADPMQISLPSLKFPSIGIPKLTSPAIAIPRIDVSVPTISISIPTISIPIIDIPALDMPTMQSTAGAEWINPVMPVGFAAPSVAALCGTAGSPACIAAGTAAGTPCAGSTASIAAACMPTVTGLAASVTSSGTVSHGTTAAAGSAAVTPAGCEPGKVATSVGCESLTELLQRKVTEARNRLSSNQALYEQQLSPAERAAADEEPWIRYPNNGKAVERLVAKDPEIQANFEPQGGAGRPDLVGRLDGEGYEITTTNPSTIAAHLRRAYVAIERLATYVQW